MIDDTIRDTTRHDRWDAERPLGDDQTIDEVLTPGTVLGRFIVHRALGAGGAGVVYAAHDPELDRTIALKVLRRGLADQGDARTRFLREAQALARLSHPNVISVYDVGAANGCTFIAMEYIHGHTFGAWVAASGAAWPEIVAVLIKAGRGLAAAHAAGLIHRDFKPANLLVGDDGRVVVTDFGLARSAMTDADDTADPHPAPLAVPRSSALAESLTRTGAVQGTPAYMAPEQHRGKPADARADQFSFCVTLYEAVFGVHPFLSLPAADSTVPPASSPEDVAAGAGLGQAIDVPRIPSNSRGAPAWLQRAVLRGLSVRPDDRFPSMDRLLAALNHQPAWGSRGAIAGGAALLVGLVVVVGLVSRSVAVDQRCTGAAAAYAATWNLHRRGAIEAAFAASHTSSSALMAGRVTAALDQYAERWTQAHTATCRATRILGEQTEVTLDLRMACLERRRQESDALIATLATADTSVVTRSIDAALGLLDVAACADIATLQQIVPPPSDPAVRARLAALTSRLAEAEAKETTGLYNTGLALVRPLADAAQVLGYRPLEAEAMYLRARLESQLGKAAEAESSLEAAVWAAEAGRHDQLAARAWAQLVFVVGNDKAEYARALALVPRATAALARIGGNPAIEALLENALGAIELGQSKLESAIPHFEKAVALRERTFGSDHPDTARAVDSLALALLKQGDAKRALALGQRTLATVERVLGPDHPDTARQLTIVGDAYITLGEPAVGEQLLRRALKIREAAYGVDHPEVARNLGDLAHALRAQGRADAALEIDRRQIVVAERAFGPDHPTFAMLTLSVGQSLAQTGHYADAAAHLRRAEAIFTRLYGPDHAMALLVRVVFGDILIVQERWHEAITALEALLPAVEKSQESLDARQDVRVNLALAYLALRQPLRALAVIEPLVAGVENEAPAWQGHIHFMRARALWDSGRDHQRAHEHAVAARAGFARAKLAEALAKVDHWLARHPAP